MRSRILALVFALAFVAEASADEIGAQLGFPIPTAEIGDHQLGIQGGLTASLFPHDKVGIGLDAAYHFWPVSPEFKATFERPTLWLVRIGDSTWNISAIQTTGHLKIVPPWRSAFRPWGQIGAGLYLVNPMLDFLGEKLDSKFQRGAYGSLGFDYDANPRLRVGLDVSYHHLWTKGDMGSDFDAVEVGTHLLFGRPSRP